MGKYIEVPVRVFAGILLIMSALVGVHLYEASRPQYIPATQLAKQAIPGVVVIECYTPSKKEGVFDVSNTAGFVATEKGHIITVAHGLTQCLGKKQKNIRVRFWEDPSIDYRAVILRIDEKLDAAILQVPAMPRSITPLDIDLSEQEQGARVIIVGHPQLFYWSVADGVVSSDRFWERDQRHLIQISAPMNFGNSGGPIINDKGSVIGVASFFVDNPSLGFIVPMDTFVRLAKGLNF